MPNHDIRSSSSKWNVIRSKAVPSNVTTSASDTPLLLEGDVKKSKRRKDVLPAKLHRQPAYFESDPHSSTYK